ncbi:uncharacterized protein [Salvelinus alpinus]|uniref:uncharacterized protein n=1 Tax=Salvelinus alpinus TaxID=8036 RepID=UPI0039FC5E3C
MDKKRSKPSSAQFRKKRKEEEKCAEDKGALLKYFGAPSGTSQDEEPSTSSATQAYSEIISEPQDEDPSTSSATQASSEMISEPQDEDPSTSSATQASSEMISEPQDEEPSTSSATQASSQMLSEPEDEDPFASTSPHQDSSEMPVTASPPNPAAEDEPLSTDPADWPSVLTDRIQTQLVCRGPSEVPPNFVSPRNESDRRSCHHQYFRKTL